MKEKIQIIIKSVPKETKIIEDLKKILDNFKKLYTI
jgi:hypothetical protein